MSSKMGAVIDQIFTLEQQRAKIAKQEADVKKKIAKLEEQLLKRFTHSELEGSTGRLGTASVRRRVVGTIKNRNKFMLFATKKKNWDLLELRISNQAYRDRLESRVKVPGVEPFTRVTVKVTKRKRKQQ